MWVNGEKTLCWPQELFVVKLHDDDISFQDDEFDGDDDAPLAVVDDLSEDWVSVSSPGSSKLVEFTFIIFINKLFVYLFCVSHSFILSGLIFNHIVITN